MWFTNASSLFQACTHCSELMKSVRGCYSFNTIIHVLRWETITFIHAACFYCFMVQVHPFCVVPSLSWKSLSGGLFFEVKEKRKYITPTQRDAGVIGARSLPPLSSRCKKLPPPMPLCMFTEISVWTEEWETHTQIDMLTRHENSSTNHSCKTRKLHNTKEYL
jgi:hypothetical protein